MGQRYARVQELLSMHMGRGRGNDNQTRETIGTQGGYSGH